MDIKTILTIIAIALLITSCGPRVQPTPTPKSTGRVSVLSPQDLDLPADALPTVENPTLRLVITIVDQTTGQPLLANVLIDDAQDYTTSTLDITLAANRSHTVTVSAAGYQPWATVIDSYFQHDKGLEIAISLQPW